MQTMEGLTNLQQIKINCNGVEAGFPTKCPTGFQYLTKLEIADLSENEWEYIDEGISY